ncbi:MAG: FliH/SctL family protein [Campylobacterota bacterium]|nr:FliH/SctL family protein [Campylobacterota bacterium]
MDKNNVNTTSKIIKSNSEAQPFELGSFVTSTEVVQNDKMKSVATLKDKVNPNEPDPLLIEIQKLQSSIEQVQAKVVSIETNGVNSRELDKQLIQALKDLKNYSSFFEQATFQMENKILKTSLSIAQKIIGIEVGEKSSLIAKETIENIMNKIKTASKVTIHLNPKDYLYLKDQIVFENHIVLLEDPNVTAGGVVIASDLGNFDGNIESKVQTMLESLDAVI